MWRRLHSALGLFALVVVLALAVSGAILSVYPIKDGIAAAPVGTGQSVADIAGPLANALPDIESIEVSPSGQISVQYSDADGLPLSGIVDPSSGAIIASSPEPGWFYAGLKDFHRGFLMGDNGRILAGVGALVMAALSLSGLALLVARMGGWRRIFDAPKGSFAARLHTILTRVALLPLLLSSSQRSTCSPSSSNGSWSRMRPRSPTRNRPKDCPPSRPVPWPGLPPYRYRTCTACSSPIPAMATTSLPCVPMPD